MFGAKKRASRADSAIPWGGKLVESSDGAEHFAVLGTTGSGKTLTMRMLMKHAFGGGGVLRSRALVYDPKLDALPILRGLGVPEQQIHIMHPFDARSRAWDIAADTDDRKTEQQIAALLASLDDDAEHPFFAQAARTLVGGVIRSFRLRGVQWCLNDIVEATATIERLEGALRACDDTADLPERFLKNEKTSADVLTTVDTKLAPFATVAAAWTRNTEPGLSLRRDWLEAEEPSIIVLGTDDSASEAIDPINRALFQRAAQLLTGRDDLSASAPDSSRAWVFIDEARLAGEFEGLTSLLVKGRSKGVRVALGFQDIMGMRDVYGREVTEELLGQCSFFAVLRLSSPETAEWASRYFGQSEQWTENTSENWTPGASRSHGIGRRIEKRDFVLPQEFRNFRPPSKQDKRGIQGAFATPQGAWVTVVSPSFINKRLEPLNEAVAGFQPRPAADQERSKWTADDLARLALNPTDKSSSAAPRTRPTTIRSF